MSKWAGSDRHRGTNRNVGTRKDVRVCIIEKKKPQEKKHKAK